MKQMNKIKCQQRILCLFAVETSFELCTKAIESNDIYSQGPILKVIKWRNGRWISSNLSISSVFANFLPNYRFFFFFYVTYVHMISCTYIENDKSRYYQSLYNNQSQMSILVYLLIDNFLNPIANLKTHIYMQYFYSY